MKKISFLNNAILAGIILFMSCNKTDLSDSNGNNSTGLNAAGAKGGVASKTDCPACKDYSTVPLNGMLASTAKTISEFYKAENQPELQISEGVPDANSVWFSLETLKNFIYKVESSVCRKGCTDKMYLGLRLYYAKYPVSNAMSEYPDLEGVDQSFGQHHTIFMVPTFQTDINSQEHIDFDPWHWGNSSCRPTSMSEWFAHGDKPFGDENSLIFSLNEDQYFSVQGGGFAASALNHGDLIPPYPLTGTGY